eukprot:GFUD01054414.1.p1 GENE.GFUD01054414.1~~GFUD01054414.1.p1  ORF type:complete len:137 (+),score=14.72 GFUD01054414.1:74-484(+)
MYSILSFLALMILLCLVDTGTSILCNECSSIDDSQCGDPFMIQVFLRECPEDGTEYFCSKIKNSKEKDWNGDYGITRKCMVKVKDESQEDQCYWTVLEGYEATICTCDTDGCNTARMYKLSTAAMLLPVMLAILGH